MEPLIDLILFRIRFHARGLPVF